jgi:UDP-N-acetylmuramoyl-L-alanyl-D-glutamate--2,6-diaminopimelate ligase
MYRALNALIALLKKIIPESLVRALRPLYHAAISCVMALAYGLPARELTVIGITGTKGKSTSAEMLFAVLKEAGYKTALLSTIRFAIQDESEPNTYKMSLPGRGFAQAFMRKARDKGCTHLVIEVTSESTIQFRHWFLALDGLLVTNIQKEHIESHGSFEKYVSAKRELVHTLEQSPKRNRVLVANADIAETRGFLEAKVPHTIGCSASELTELTSDIHTTSFTLPLAGAFNALNALGVIKIAEAFGVARADAKRALSTLPLVRGRVEHIEAGQDFLAVVDYAHTPDSLEALYSAYPMRKICVLGNTGGGRDTWKRSLMGKIADTHCTDVVLTNEDPYDENPRAIVEAMTKEMSRPPKIIMDRREAIRHALSVARSGDAVLISGKGTDPYIMEARGKKTPWDDAAVVREELLLLAKKV